MHKPIFIALLLATFTACAPKPSNEISEMALECFKNKQGISIHFIPQVENKEAQKVEN